MTQDEVDLIYDYLHENYYYRDGELITKNTRGCRKKCSSVGYFNYEFTWNDPQVQVRLMVSKKSLLIDIRKLIYIYHQKKWCKYIKNKDGNILNSKIENLISLERNPENYKNKPRHNNKLNIKGVSVTGEEKKYRATMTFKGKQITLGRYDCINLAKNSYDKAKKLSNNFNGTLYEFEYLLKEKGMLWKRKYPVGVCKARNKYSSTLIFNGNKKHIGTFNTPEEAHAAYLKAKEEYKNG